MENLKPWEIARIFAYIFGVIGVVFCVIGMVFNAAAFGISGESSSLVRLFGNTFFNGGVVCGAISGLMVAATSDILL
jgi:hypothetical protein